MSLIFSFGVSISLLSFLAFYPATYQADHPGHEDSWDFKKLFDFTKDAYNWSDVFRKRWYLVVKEPKMTWAEAVYACATHLMELTDFETPEELVFIDGMIKRRENHRLLRMVTRSGAAYSFYFENNVSLWWNTSETFWIGGSKHSQVYNRFYWFSSGKVVMNPFWQLHQPPSRQDKESCTIMRNYPNQHNFSAHASHCHYRYGFVCKSKCIV